MSQYGHGGYNGLKAFAFTVGVTVLIFALLYVTKRYNPRLFGRETFLRSHPWYLGGPIEPPAGRSDGGRRSLGEKPMMWDVWIASWYPPCPQRESRSEKEGEKSDPGCPAWAELLPLSADKVSDPDTAVSLPRVLGSCNPVQRSTPSTQTRISTIVLMPAPPRPTSLPSTSSPNSASHDAYDPPREYALGTSYIPSAPNAP